MSCISSPVPSISISPAPEEDPIVEPFSPFSVIPVPPRDQNVFRPSHLTPPPTIITSRHSLSPSHSVPVVGKGLESQKFQVLLAATKQRKVSGGSNQNINFRKEIAMKAHANRHSDRRSLFLSKIQAPPSPIPIAAPKTPPESPRILHHSLPSPGLESPLTLFESWSGDHDVPHTWAEPGDFLLVDEHKPKPSLNPSFTKPACGIPSLDQISARFPRPAIKTTCEASPRPSVGIGRLRMPLRTQALQTGDQHKSITSKTYVIPRSPSLTTAQAMESNLSSLNSRDQKASNMLFTLRKRRLSLELNSTALQETAIESEDASSKLRWRLSAPADMTPLRARFGFEHPVLASPGGF